MPARRTISFGEFHLDPHTRQLTYRGAVRPLRSKTFAVLWYLASNPGRLVPQDELMRAVWPETSVGAAVLRVSIREIRAALGGAAHLLVTVPRQGHRFVFDVDNDARSRPFVGRAAELSRLTDAWLRADAGSRQIVLVTGEAGVGKSSLVKCFLDELRAAGSVRIVSGQCVELHDGLEPYAPLVDLLGRACHGFPDDPEFGRALARWAPSWLPHLSDRDGPGGDDGGVVRRMAPSSARLQRELSALLEGLADQQPLVVELQDLHWADVSTLDALAHLAERDVPARLLIVGTLRPNDGVHAERLDAVRRRLLARRPGSEVQLGMLDATDVERFLVQRLSPMPLGKDVAAIIYDRTRGHPLFLTALTDHLLAQRQLVVNEGGWRVVGTLDGVIPTAIREMIATSFQTVSPEHRRILEAASVAGTTFSATAISAALGLSIGEVEDACDQLVAERWLAHGGLEQWTGDTTSAHYAFVHQMHAEVLYGSLTPATRSRYHRLVGESVSSANAGHVRDVAAVLAHHFTLAGDEERAWYAHRQAARAARDGLAAREAIGHLEAALTMIRALPPSVKRANVELRCLLELGEAVIAVHGYAAPRVAGIYQRACEVATVTDDAPLHVLAESGLLMHHAMRGDLTTAQRRADEIVQLARRAPMLIGTGYGGLGSILLSRGDLAAALDFFERASASWEAWPGVALDLRAMLDGFHATCRLVLGNLRAAREDAARMLARVAELPFDPLLVAQCEAMAAFFHAACGARDEGRAAAARALQVADAHGLPLYLSPRVVYGWATGDAATIRAEIEVVTESGVRLGIPQYAALLAETLLSEGDVAAAEEALDRGLAAAVAHGEHYYLAELHRLRGRCRLHRASTAPPREQRALLAAAQESFELAISVASGQGARLWLLRAAADVCESAPRPAHARARLRDVLRALDDGSDLPDLVRARELVADG